MQRQRICSDPDCEEPHEAGGWCNKHYKRLRRLGRTALLMPEERFWLKVDKNGPIPEYRPDLGPCWLWTAGTIRGYGRFCVGPERRNVFAHRYAYELLVGPIPAGLDMDHLCRVPACVRPSHLEPVTHQENNRRGVTGLATGAQQRAKTHCPAGHPYDEANTHRSASGKRKCRTCHRETQRRYVQRRQLREGENSRE
jgi:hypothetical protein